MPLYRRLVAAFFGMATARVRARTPGLDPGNAPSSSSAMILSVISWYRLAGRVWTGNERLMTCAPWRIPATGRPGASLRPLDPSWTSPRSSPSHVRRHPGSALVSLHRSGLSGAKTLAGAIVTQRAETAGAGSAQ